MKIRINIIKYLANLKFAIVLLILIASLSILGTVIEQDQTVEFYKINYQQTIYSIRVWQIIIRFGLNHIFKTSWFIGLLIIFGSSLICCTFIQQLPILKNAKKIFFYRKSNQFYKLPLNSKIQNISTGNLLNNAEASFSTSSFMCDHSAAKCHDVASGNIFVPSPIFKSCFRHSRATFSF